MMNNASPVNDQDRHYLREELYLLLQNDSRIFEFLQAGSLDGIWYWDLENPSEEWMSQRFWETFGYEAAEMPHKSAAWQHMINQDDLASALKNFEAHCADENHPYDQVVRYRHKDGSTVWVRCRGLAIRDQHGKPVRMIGAHTDITEVKRTAQSLHEKNEQLEVLNDQLTEFAYAASHDLRSPIRALGNLLSILNEEHYHQLDSEGQKILELALTSVNRANTMAAEILSYSKAGVSFEAVVFVDAEQLISEIEDDLKQEFEQTHTQLEVSPLPVFKARPIQVRRVFQNLIANALKFQSEKPGVQRKISIAASVKEDRIIFSVADNGIGIQQEELKSIFSAFKQLNNKSRYEGTGLGLSICQRIILSQGGSIWAESELGIGTTIYFSLPSKPEGHRL